MELRRGWRQRFNQHDSPTRQERQCRNGGARNQHYFIDEDGGERSLSGLRNGTARETPGSDYNAGQLVEYTYPDGTVVEYHAAATKFPEEPVPREWENLEGAHSPQDHE